MYSIKAQLVQKALVRHGVKCLAKIEYSNVNLAFGIPVLE